MLPPLSRLATICVFTRQRSLERTDCTAERSSARHRRDALVTELSAQATQRVARNPGSPRPQENAFRHQHHPRLQGQRPEKVRESQRRRFADVALVDKVIAEDEEWRRLVALADDKRGEKNAKQKEITALKKAKKEVDPQMLKDLKALDAKVKEAEAATEPQLQKVLKLFNTIGNLVEDSVPVSNDEDKDNEVVNKWGTCKQDAKYSHHELLYMIGGYEPERGVRVAGHRAYFFTDYGVLLNQAVINYGIAFLRKKQYKILQPPYMMNKDLMGGVAQLSEFDEALYKVTGGDQEKYLIATSEQPDRLPQGQWLQESELPLRYAGVSTCFRKEAGSHGRDTWGIFRVHQFEKVEQFCLTTGDLEKSNEMHEEMREIAEEYIQSMGFPYHVVNIVSGELNNAAIKKYDIECWFPYQKKYRELVSCSNCTDYQSRAMEVRCGGKKMGSREKKYVHMLNSTLCLWENYLLPPRKQPDGDRCGRTGSTATVHGRRRLHAFHKNDGRPAVQGP